MKASPAAGESPFTVLYRGSLRGCNYDCRYCPFSKAEGAVDDPGRDREELARFVDWCGRWCRGDLRIFFVPRGEALGRPWYREAVERLSLLPRVARVAAQTNLSWDPEWIGRCDAGKLGLWATYHPGQAERSLFVERCRELRGSGIRISAGAVGTKEGIEEIESLRRELPREIYLWVNARKDGPALSREEAGRLEAIDPLFPLNRIRYPSLGRPCRAGAAAVAVVEGGEVRRCPFTGESLGDLEDPRWIDSLGIRPCPRPACHCHIGYVHLEELGLEGIFGEGILERIPGGWPGSAPVLAEAAARIAARYQVP